MSSTLIDYRGAFDTAFFEALNSVGNPFLDGFFTVITHRWFGIAVGILFAAWLIYTKRWSALRWLLALALALFLSDFVGHRVLKPLFARMRPCYALPEGAFNWVVHAGNVGSLPSLHASNFFAFALIAHRADTRLTAPAFVIATLVACSRVYVGVHWPTDILAGALWGSLVALLALWLTGLGEKAWTAHRARRSKRPTDTREED